MFIYGEGTVYVLLTACTGREYVGVVHNCLQGTGLHDLLSLSQLQILSENKCSLVNSDPCLIVNNIRFTLYAHGQRCIRTTLYYPYSGRF